MNKVNSVIRQFVLLFGLTAIRANALQTDSLPAVPQRTPVDVFVSVGDIHWDYRFQPLDSVYTVEAYIERLASSQKARRVYWRGEQDADVLRNGVFRMDNPLQYEHWNSWQRSLNTGLDLNKVAVRAAHKHHIKMIMVQSLFDFGGPADSDPATMPYTYEDKLRKDHPEWIPIDRSGKRRQPGPLEFAYPGVRKALIERWTKEIRVGRYDGIQLYTYFENYGTSYEDEFGFNDPIVAEYLRRYGVDIRNQDFDKDKWKSLRGEYVTLFLSQLHSALAKEGKLLSVNLSAHAPEKVQDWPLNTGHYLISTKMDWQTWVHKKLVDEIAIAGGTETEQIAFATKILDGSPNGETLPSIFSERPTFQGFDPLIKRGMSITGWSAPFPSQPMERYYFGALDQKSIKSDNWLERGQAIAQAGVKELKSSPQDIISALRDDNPLIRRQAVNACILLKLRTAKPDIERLLSDTEQSVCASAALALGDLGDVDSIAKMLVAVEKNPSWIFKESVSTGMSKLGSVNESMIIPALSHPEWTVRQVAARSLRTVNTPSAVNALILKAQRDPANTVRYYALQSLRSHPSQPFLNLLMDSLHDKSPLVNSYSASCLGELVTLMRPEQKKRALDELSMLILEYGTKSMRSDKDWGWRLVGSALKQLGPEGMNVLEKLRTQSTDNVLAWRAFMVMYLPLGRGTFPTYTESEVETAFKSYAPVSKP